MMALQTVTPWLRHVDAVAASPCPAPLAAATHSGGRYCAAPVESPRHAKELRSLAGALAYDLRGPLDAIDGFSRELLRRVDSRDPVSRHYLERVQANVQRMSTMTEALLSLAAVFDAQLVMQSIDLSAIARAWQQSVSDAKLQCRAVVRIAESPRVLGDSRLLAVLLGQLLHNASKFSSRQQFPSIDFGAEQDTAGQAVYFVRDNGVGFDPAEAAGLFTPFRRLHSETDFPGTGMGLALARGIVERHGGRIWAESEPGRGACIRFTLASARGAGTRSGESQARP